MDEVRSKPLMWVYAWIMVIFNGLFFWLVCNPSAATLPPQRFEFRQTHMGSEFRLVLYSTDAAKARRASDRAFARIAALDRSWSDYDPESELMRLCDRAGGPPVRVSDDLFRALEKAQAVARRSGGAYDPTVGPVVRLWRRARRQRQRPDPKLVAEALARVGHDKMKLDPRGRTVQLSVPGMKLDLGGIGKGLAADEALTILRQEGVTSALVAGAGDVVVSDPPLGEEGWTIGIAPLESPGAARPSRFLSLRNRAVSTSGDAERFVEIDGVRYSHIVDPRTGLGLTGRTSVTTVAPDGGTADALATAVAVLGPEKGLRLVETVEGAAALVVTGEGQTVESARWKDVPAGRPKEVPPG